MRAGLGVLGTLVTLIGAACCSSAEQEPEFTSLFDGKTLSGWTLENTDRFSVQERRDRERGRDRLAALGQEISGLRIPGRVSRPDEGIR